MIPVLLQDAWKTPYDTRGIRITPAFINHVSSNHMRIQPGPMMYLVHLRTLLNDYTQK